MRTERDLIRIRTRALLYAFDVFVVPSFSLVMYALHLFAVPGRHLRLEERARRLSSDRTEEEEEDVGDEDEDDEEFVYGEAKVNKVFSQRWV